MQMQRAIVDPISDTKLTCPTQPSFKVKISRVREENYLFDVNN